MKLLLAVDSSTTSNMLLDEVVVRSWPEGTEARVLSVVDGIGSVRQEVRRREEQITALAVERLRSAGIPTEVTIMRGNPNDAILLAARKWAADLILIRAHNRADVRNLTLGSVAKSVLETAPCSVEVVRTGDETDSTRDRRNFKILLATDGSSASLTASQVVAHATWPQSTEVKVVSVVNPVTYSLEDLGLWSDKGTERAHRAICNAVQALKNAPLKIMGEVIADRVVRGILDHARHWQADLIVLGVHDRRGLKRLFFSGTSTAIAKRAHCSVRVVRGHRFSFRRSTESPENPNSMYKNVGLRRAA